MRKISILTLLIMLTISLHAGAITDKRGGIWFRMDDNHKPYHWEQISAVFNKHGMPFCASLNIGSMDEELYKTVIELQKNGHEVLDHTPYHNQTIFFIPEGKTAADYENKPGVDHIEGNKVCLTYKTPTIPDKKKKDGFIKDGKLILPDANAKKVSRTYKAGDLSAYIFDTNECYYAKYIKGSDPVAFNLYSFWDRKTLQNPADAAKVKFYFMRAWNFKMSADAYKLLAAESLERFKKIGAERPYTMIAAGGGLTSPSANEIKPVYGDIFGYKSSACWGGKADKVYNEPDANGYNRFGMTWHDFDDEGKDLQWNKTRIAEQIALHKVMTGHSHLNSRVGGWKGYMDRLDKLLAWCKENNIPVRTQSQWADILYGDTKQQADINIFPHLYNDLDGNNNPDGYKLEKTTEYDKENGPDSSNKHCLKFNQSGPAFKIDRLGGLEKGANKLSFKLKGAPESTVAVKIVYRESGRKYNIRKKYSKLNFKLEGSDWQTCTGDITIPEKASVCYINVEANLATDAPLYFSSPKLKP